MNPLRIIDDWLNGVTMYRLLLYGLGVLAGVSLLFALTGQLSLPVPAALLSLGIVLTVCYVANRVLGRTWQAATNSESSLITALILFFILPPATDWRRAVAIGLAGLLAMASKYMLARHRKHIFNPAAAGAVLVGLLGVVHATWWIGSPVLLLPSAVLGLLVVRKIRRIQMFVSFAAAALLMILLRDQMSASVLSQAFTSWPLVFMGTIMLTEPSTSPPHFRQQMLYGALVGGVFTLQLRLGPVASTPEIALVLGNVLAYVWSPKFKVRLRLKATTQLAPQVYDVAFEPDRTFTFQPGQYMEWTLPHAHADARGNRRTFTIASSPTEALVHVGVKTYNPSSTFKKAFLALRPGDHVVAGQIAGDFTLPPDARQKLAFVAGGIGITPFRSMAQYLIDTKQQRDIVLIYIVSRPEELSYGEVWKRAEAAGVRLVPVLAAKKIPQHWHGRTGYLTKEMLAETVPDLRQRHCYLSGPSAMVDHYAGVLRAAGARRIVTDHFSGY
jgi:glycine betaine catabolism B